MKSTFILLCFLLFLSSVSGIDLSKFNTAYWYDPAAPLTVKSRVVQRSDNHNVFLSLSMQSFGYHKYEIIIADQLF